MNRYETLMTTVLLVCLATVSRPALPMEPLDVWPDLAPGESARHVGEALPAREGEVPPVTRLVNITRPTLSVHPATNPTGTAVVILPGGGFSRIVPDKEGTEAAAWLNTLGISAFVLRYRTKAGDDDPGWQRPLQDAQRSLSLIRANAERFGLRSDRVGILGFSAGGQVAARLLSGSEDRSYQRIDEVDDTSFRPDFALLVYPWNIFDARMKALVDGLQVPPDHPPTFLIHTDDDASSSLGTVLYYAALKQHRVPAELHVYGNGGHGYGLRPVAGSQISSWTDHAAHWLATRELSSRPQ